MLGKEGINVPIHAFLIWTHSSGVSSLKKLYETWMEHHEAFKESDDPIFDFVSGLIMLAHHQFIFFR